MSECEVKKCRVLIQLTLSFTNSQVVNKWEVVTRNLYPWLQDSIGDNSFSHIIAI